MKQFCIVSVDRDRVLGHGWNIRRTSGDGVYVDAVVITASKEKAFLVADENKQDWFFSVDTTAAQSDRFLVEATEDEIWSLFRDGKIDSFFVLFKKPNPTLPSAFSVEDADSLKRLPKGLQETAKPVGYELVFVPTL